MSNKEDKVLNWATGILLVWLILLLGTMILTLIPELGSIMLVNIAWRITGLIVAITGAIMIGFIIWLEIRLKKTSIRTV